MITENFSSTAQHWDAVEPLSPVQKHVLHRAVSKIIALGAGVGISADQMIQLLQSGLTVGELLDYLAVHSREIA